MVKTSVIVMKLNLAKKLTEVISHRAENKIESVQEGGDVDYDPCQEFENLIDELFEKKSKIIGINGDNYNIFTNPDSGKKHYLTDSQTVYIKQQIMANAMQNSFINYIGMGQLCHKTTSYFQDLDSIIESMESTPTTIVNGRWVKPEFKVDKGSFVEYVCEDGEVIIPNVQSKGRGIYQNFDNNLGRIVKLITCFGTALAVTGCVTATEQLSVYDAQPGLLTKQYTPDEIAVITQGFKNNPLQHSQEFGELLLWQMYQKSPKFALGAGRLPDILNGINASEAKGMELVLINYLNELDIPQNLFSGDNTRDNTYEIIFQWKGNKGSNSDWSGYLMGVGTNSKYGKVINVTPIGFEQGEDSIDYEGLEGYGAFDWTSFSNKMNSDGFNLNFQFGSNNKLTFYIKNTPISFTKSELVSKRVLTYNEKDGLDGILTIKTNIDIQPEIDFFKKMVLAGEGKYKYNAFMEALLWGYMDGMFKGGDNLFKIYDNPLELVKDVWGNMEGPKWKDFEIVTSRLNKPKLIDHYTQNVFKYKFFISKNGSAKFSFNKKINLNCIDFEVFVRYCLNKAGYNASPEKVIPLSGAMNYYHIITTFKDKNSLYIINNGTTFPTGIIGPFKSLKDSGYKKHPFF